MRLLAVGLVALGCASRLTAADVDFARDVLPILSDNCFHCHGPDAGQRKAALSSSPARAAKANWSAA